MKDSLDRALVTAYEQAIFEITFPEGVVTLSRFNPPDPWTARLVGRSVTVVTAYNPVHERPGEAGNRGANEKLREHLEQQGWEFFPAVGGNVEHTYQEPSFAVMNLNPNEAQALGERFGQAAVFYWDGRVGDLLWCRRAAS